MANELRAPQQDRSRDKLERIYACTIEILVAGGWDAVTLREVERRSGISRSTFYLRFATREALLDYTTQRLLDEVAAAEDEAFGLARAAGDTVPAAVSAAIEAFGQIVEKYGVALMRLDRVGRDGAGANGMTKLSNRMTTVLAQPSSADFSSSTLEFAVELIFAAFVAKISPRPTFPAHTDRRWEDFTAELATAVTGYLLAGR